MIRSLIPVLLVAVAMPAAEGHARSEARLGTVVGRQVVDAGHILEVRALSDGQYLVRWGDLDNVITGHAGKGSAFTWDGGVSCQSGLSFVRTVAFEDGSKAKAGAKGGGDKAGSAHGDRITADGYGGQVTWKARTTGAWDGVVVKAAGHGTLEVHAGSASLSVALP